MITLVIGTRPYFAKVELPEADDRIVVSAHGASRPVDLDVLVFAKPPKIRASEAGFVIDDENLWEIDGEKAVTYLSVDFLGELRKRGLRNKAFLSRKLKITYQPDRDVLLSPQDRERKQRLAALEAVPGTVEPMVDRDITQHRFGPPSPNEPPLEYLKGQHAIRQECLDAFKAAGLATTMVIGRAVRDARDQCKRKPGSKGAAERATAEVQQIRDDAERSQRAAEGVALARERLALARLAEEYGQPVPASVGSSRPGMGTRSQ